MMKFKVYKAEKTKDFLKQEKWIRTDITSKVVMPIIDVSRLDRALDTTSLTYIDNSPTANKPFTKIIINIKNPNETIYRYVHNDTVQVISYGTQREYRHILELIEPTKALERFAIDNTTITNLLAFLYDDDPVITGEPAKEELTSIYTSSNKGAPFKTYLEYPISRYSTKYIVNSSVVPMIIDPYVEYTYYHDSPTTGPWEERRKQRLSLFRKAELIAPNGERTDITNNLFNHTPITFTQSGDYTISYSWKDTLDVANGETTYIEVTYQWAIKSVSRAEYEKKPTRYTIYEVVDEILSRVAHETTAPRLYLDTPLFSLNRAQGYRLNKIYSPEFTFTQNTLFGVLEQIGNYIHAIPRLVPKRIQTSMGLDDWSDWSEIRFDFLDEHENTFVLEETPTSDNSLANSYDIISTDQAFNGENYATSFVTNVQNSFQTNKADYVSLVEPYDGGYISSRTTDGNFEISNDVACIKTTRPIQRIVSLEVGVELITDSGSTEFFNIDITQRVKEITDYNLLRDYASSDIDMLDAKSSAIYYTRGTNVIDGLAYYPPKALNIEYLATNRAIQNIISIMGRSQYPDKLSNLVFNKVTDLTIKDLMFRIKYIPFYNFKAMQYKQVINDSMGDNTLFYNQQDSQQVDIESLGENVRGALMMTANKEFSLTGYSKLVKDMKAGDVLKTTGTYGNESNFYAYQINREFIDNNTIRASITFSKNFNKWNDYIAIRKNYREWEISNRESIETNPISNQFLIVSDHSDFENLSAEQKTALSESIQQYKGFISQYTIDAIMQSLGKVDTGIAKPIRWALIKTRAYNDIEHITEAKRFFLPCACFGYGNSLILNFATQDNYSAGTTVKPSQNIKYGIENFVSYCNSLGKVDTMEVAYGYDELLNGFDTIEKALRTSKEFYALRNDATIYESNVAVDYRDSPFIIKKDSRQQLNFTSQLNFISDNPNIWISPEFVNKMIYVGAPYQEKSVKWVYFKKAPSIFLDKINIDDILKVTDIVFDDPLNPDDQNTIVLQGAEQDTQFVGVGLVATNNESESIDNDSTLLIYYNKDTKYNGKIYLKIRSKI